MSEMLTSALHWIRLGKEPVQFLSSLHEWTCSALHKHSGIWHDSAGAYKRCLDCGRRIPSANSL